MKTLHQLKPPLLVPVWFFSETHPCMGTYHDGFAPERTDAIGHEGCLPEEPDMAGRSCRCRTCPTHFYHEKYNYQRFTFDTTTCPNCLAEQHPEINEDTIDRRTNHIVGTVEDLEHFGGDPIEFEEDNE